MPKSEAEMCMCERAASRGRAMTCLRCTGSTMPNPDTRAVVTEAYPAAERAFHVVIRNKGEPDEVFVASDRATLSGFPAKSREDAHAMAASLNRVVAFHAERHRIAAEARVSAREEALREALQDILPGKLCGEGWNLPDTETVSIVVTFGKIKAARVALHIDGAGS